jgi:hypothetical protein
LLPAPTAPSEGYAGVRNLVIKPEGPRPALDPGSPAQASLPIKQLPRERSQTSLLQRATRGFASGSIRPARHKNRSPRPKPSDVPRPFLGKPLLRPALLPAPPKSHSKPRRARGNSLFRRLFPTGPEKNPKALSIACRRRSDLWSPAAPILPLPTLRGGRDRRPDHPRTLHLSSESGKRKMREQACG